MTVGQLSFCVLSLPFPPAISADLAQLSELQDRADFQIRRTFSYSRLQPQQHLLSFVDSAPLTSHSLLSMRFPTSTLSLYNTWKCIHCAIVGSALSSIFQFYPEGKEWWKAVNVSSIMNLQAAERASWFRLRRKLADVYCLPPRGQMITIYMRPYPNVLIQHHLGVSKIFPGFKSQCGSNACFMLFITMIVSGPASWSNSSFLKNPIECSPWSLNQSRWQYEEGVALTVEVPSSSKARLTMFLTWFATAADSTGSDLWYIMASWKFPSPKWPTIEANKPRPSSPFLEVSAFSVSDDSILISNVLADHRSQMWIRHGDISCPQLCALWSGG